jgi:hypothetical protein
VTCPALAAITYRCNSIAQFSRYNKTSLDGKNWSQKTSGPVLLGSKSEIEVYHGGINVAMTGAQLYLKVRDEKTSPEIGAKKST